jgi:hypothetical protein
VAELHVGFFLELAEVDDTVSRRVFELPKSTVSHDTTYADEKDHQREEYNDHCQNSDAKFVTDRRRKSWRKQANESTVLKSILRVISKT